MKYSTKWKRHGDGQLYSDRAVMNLLLQGKSRTDISLELEMPLGTVNTCCTRIYRKEGCSSLAELIIKHSAD